MKHAAAMILAAAAIGPGDPGRPVVVTLDPAKEGRTFEGIGALSAGASSRLLIDYPEPARGHVLDYLFKPGFGASLHHFKVEIGGDVNSTDGCEPSHQRTRDDEDYTRGYEWWMMKEARARNPKIILDALEWGAPGWIGGGKFYSQDNADFIGRFLRGAKAVHGLDIEYVGIWNETPFDVNWIKLLRKTLDRDGLKDVKIVAADEVNTWKIVTEMQKDPDLAAAIHTVGTHYPKFKSPEAAKTCGKPIWSSEDGPWNGTWAGACALAKMYNRNYAVGRMTKTIIWSPVTSYYDNLPLPGSGFMRANTPWSGHYEVQPAIWATAHTTQFAQPGWKYLDDACALLAGGGSHVALKAPDGKHWSVVVETMDAKERQDVTFRVTGGLSTGPVRVWKTGPSEAFVRLEDAKAADGAFTMTFEPDCIYSITTTSGQQKGAAAVPAPAPFPLPYREDFEAVKPGSMAKYFSDQGGIFEVAARPDGKGRALRQVVPKEGIRWHYHANPPPETFAGDPAWANYEVSVDALIEKSGYAVLFGRVGTVPQNKKEALAYSLKVDDAGNWELRTAAKVLSSGKVPFSADTWHALKLKFALANIQAFIDGAPVADVTDSTSGAGMIGVGSGYHGAQFDNVVVRGDPSFVNLARGAAARASSVWDAAYGPEKAVDGDAATRWNTADGKTAGEWLEIEFRAPAAVESVVLRQFENRITGFAIQAWDGSKWVDAASGERFAPEAHKGDTSKTVAFPPVTASRLRVLVTAASYVPSLYEVEVYGGGKKGR
jgi:galactosylceramidase